MISGVFCLVKVITAHGFAGKAYVPFAKRTLMRLIYIVIVFLLLASTGCSSIEKCIYLKPIEKNNNWIVQRNKHYRGSYDFVTHYYYSCDSLSSIRVSFTNRVRPILIGPPIIPIFPMFSFKTETFQISISIKTYNDTDLVALSKGIHIKINDSLSFFPSPQLPMSNHPKNMTF